MRFVPEAARSYLTPPTGPTTAAERRPAVRSLLAAYRSPALLLVGGLAWLGLTAAAFLAVFGTATLVEALTVRGAAAVWVGPVLMAAGAGVGAAGGRLARDVLRAGRAISLAAEAWMLDGPPAPNTLRNRALAVASPLIPELFARLVLLSVAALGAVLALCAVGYAVWRAGTESGTDLLLSVSMAGWALLLSVLCAGVTAALWRSTSRVQRGWVHARRDA